jgi:predicted kinase
MKVIIMQGIPGSGKSTWVNKFYENAGGPTFVVSADSFFVDGHGKYNFDPSKLGAAHARCMYDFINHLSYMRHMTDAARDKAVVLVDNTNITTDQMSPYYLVARAYGASVEVRRVVCNTSEAYMRNVHGVPWDTIERMHLSMQDPPKYWESTFVVC